MNTATACQVMPPASLVAPSAASSVSGPSLAGSSRGVVLVLAVLVTSVVSALALGLAIIVSASQLAAGRGAEGAALLNAAEAGLELAAYELARRPDWNQVLSGVVVASAADGAPAGARIIPAGGWVSLTGETNQLNCGRTGPCSQAELAAFTPDRPWGANNPVWRPFLYGPMHQLGPFAQPTPAYVVVWVADDSRELDGDPLSDSALGDPHGGGVLRVRAVAYGAMDARRVVEAELARVCRRADGTLACAPGIRVQSWREVRQLAP